MEDFFCGEQSLHVGHKEQDSGVVEGGELVVQLGVEHLVSPLGGLHVLLRLDELGLVPVGVVLHGLHLMTLFIEIYQLPASLVNFFLK